MRSPRGVRPLVAAGVIVIAGAGVAVAAVALGPVRGGPPGTTGLVALLAFAMASMTGIAASGAPAGERSTRQPVHEEARLTAPALPEEVHRHPGRCFGCVRLEEVTEAGALVRGEVEVPLYVCSSCREHLEAWHAAQVAVLGATQAAAVRRPCPEIAG